MQILHCRSDDWLELHDVITLPMTPRFGVFTFHLPPVPSAFLFIFLPATSTSCSKHQYHTSIQLQLCLHSKVPRAKPMATPRLVSSDPTKTTATPSPSRLYTPPAMACPCLIPTRPNVLVQTALSSFKTSISST